MDTKLKNNNKKLWITTILVSVAAMVGFISFYPYFNNRVKQQYVLPQEREDFLDALYQFNYVTYLNMQVAEQEKHIAYDELYLSYLETVMETNSGANGAVYSTRSDTQLPYDVADQKSAIKEYFNQCEEKFSRYASNIDYCVIDKKTEEINKNTETEIENLYFEKSDVSSNYAFYVMMQFDENGNLYYVTAKSENADTVRKYLSAFTDGNLPPADNYFYWKQNQGNLYVDSKQNLKWVEMGVSGPTDACFIYACTAEQLSVLEVVSSAIYTDYQGEWEQYAAYLEAGAGNVYALFLLVIAVLALVLPYILKYRPDQCSVFRLHLEISIPAIFIWMSAVAQYIVSIVAMTNTGFEARALAREWGIAQQPAQIIVMVAGGALQVIIFGIWFMLVSSFVGMWKMGIWSFIKERCLIGHLFGYGKKYIKKSYYYLMRADLGGNMMKRIRNIVIANFFILALISLCWVYGWFLLVPYSLVLFFIIRKSVKKIQEQYGQLLEATGRIAQGELDAEITGDFGVFQAFQEELVDIQQGFKMAVKEEVKSQQMKTELITNVSHDLKTPLTAIITYVDLLKDEKITPEEQKEYIETLERKSLRLKVLIEDLFEISKANSDNVTLNIVNVDIISLMKQVRNELSDKIEESGLLFRWNLPEEKIVLSLDSQKTYRIFENLYNNILNYAMKGTRVYIDAVKTEKGIRIELKNISCEELQVDSDYLTERFVRGDSARNTEGSGLGLAIARSFTELQKGTLTTQVDGDLFKVILEWQ